MTSGSTPSAQRLLERGSSELSRVGVAEARFQAELLLRHAMGCSREYLLARLHEPVPAETTGRFFQLLERRRGRVPIQYLLGTQEFYGLEFRVTPAVLIPRPETEGVVEHCLAELGGRRRPRIVDVGCGSGCIAIALAHTLDDAEVVGIDPSPAALAVARENARRHGVTGRIHFLRGDLLAPARGRFSDVDAVVTNPPYIAEDELSGLPPEVAAHEPREALAGGRDGLAVIRRLLPQASAALAGGGLLVMEIGKGQADRVRDLITGAGLDLVRIAPDLASVPRTVVARKP